MAAGAPAGGTPARAASTRDARNEPGEERLGGAGLQEEVPGSAKFADESLAGEQRRLPIPHPAHVEVQSLGESHHVSGVADVGPPSVQRDLMNGAVRAEDDRSRPGGPEQKEPFGAEEGLGATPFQVQVDLRGARQEGAGLDV